MTTFGGLGGCMGETIPWEEWEGDLFAQAFKRACGLRVHSSEKSAHAAWSALANVDWFHDEDGHEAAWSFRAAGDLIASIRGSGDYLDWYCNSPYADVADWISEAMAAEGWRWETA